MKLFLFVLICLACSCSPQKKSTRQTIHLNISSEPPTLDLLKAGDTTSIGLLKNCFEGLMRRGQNQKLEQGMAERVELSTDQKIYTFFLKNACWSDGHPVTAYDFEAAWKTILSPSFPSPFSNDLYILKNANAAKQGLCPPDQIGVKALDAKTLQVELEHPSPYFLDLSATHSFLPVPQHIVKIHPGWADDAGAYFVSNGPYKLTKWRHHHSLSFEKNALYWDKEKVSIEAIEFTMIADETTELNLFESGQLDWVGYPLSSIPIDALKALKPRLNICPMAGIYYYVFNVNTLPFNNRNVRQAFALAIDRGQIVDHITQLGQTAALAFIPNGLKPKPAFYFKDYDLPEAKRLFDLALNEMGLTKETFPPVILSYNTAAAHQRIAQAIAYQWEHLFGIKVTLKNKEWKVFLDELAHKQFQVARMGGVASYSDPIAFLHHFRYADSEQNFAGWTNPSFTALLNEADRTSDAARRTELLEQAERIFIDEMPIAPIYFYTGAYMKNQRLKNVFLSEFSEIDFKYAYLDNDKISN